MKRFLIVLLALLVASVCFADPYAQMPPKKAAEPVQTYCPKTLISDNDLCFRCHVAPDFKVREAGPNNWRELPNYLMDIRKEDGKEVGYFLLTEIRHGTTATQVADFFLYLNRHGITKAVIELYSPGWSLFEGQRISGIMLHEQERGMVVETRLYGYAASAGFYVFVSATKGHRLTSRAAQLMFHELISFTMFDISGPSDKEDQARVLRHLQLVMNKLIVSRSNLTLERLNELIHKRELWVSGEQAVSEEYGFADGFL